MKSQAFSGSVWSAQRSVSGGRFVQSLLISLPQKTNGAQAHKPTHLLPQVSRSMVLVVSSHPVQHRLLGFWVSTQPLKCATTGLQFGQPRNESFTQLFSGSLFPHFVLVAAPLKWSSQKRVPRFFQGHRTTECSLPLAISFRSARKPCQASIP